MISKKTVYLSLFLLFFTLSGSADMQSRIAAARGREKLDLILQFLQNPQPSKADQKEPQLLERCAREALALARQLHDRRAEALSEKHLAHLEFLGMRYDPALEGCYRSRRAFKELGDHNSEADVEKEIGAIFSSVFHVFSDYGRAGRVLCDESRPGPAAPGPARNYESPDRSGECLLRPGRFPKSDPLVPGSPASGRTA